MSRHAALLALACLAGPPVAADEWYEHYRAGVKALARGEAEKAVLLLEHAAAARPEPGDSIVTYGTNLEPTYHPYLKLAEAHLALGRLEAARAALERSERWNREPAVERRRLAAQLGALEARRATPSPETPVPKAQPAATPAPARLELVTQPAGAEVYLDNLYRGSSDPRSGRLAVDGLAAGGHRLRLSAPGYEEHEEQLELGAGAELSHEIALVERPPAPPPAAGQRTAPRPGPSPERRGPAGAARSPEPQAGASARPAEATGPQPALAGEARPLLPSPPAAPGPAAHEAEPGAGGPALLLAGVALALGVGALLWRRASRPVPLPVSSSSGAAPALPSGFAEAPTAARPAAGEPQPGEWLGEYRLLRLLGRGGMALVYEAERNGEHVALKRPRPHLLGETEFLQRFEREAQIGRTLFHPHIVRIFESGEAAGLPYFTMELVTGETLQALLAREKRLDAQRAARLVSDVAEALDYAHLKGVVHRDLKPSNIMLPGDGSAKVMDYGLARAQRLEGLTATGTLLGTPEYLAPEVIEGRGGGPQSDLYALGVVFYELLCGARPFAADTPYGLMRQHVSAAPRAPRELAPDVPEPLETLVLRLLAKAPAERPAGAEALAGALREFLHRVA